VNGGKAQNRKEDKMKRIGVFIERVKRAWILANRIKIIRNGATDRDEVWFETGKEANRGICSSFYRLY